MNSQHRILVVAARTIAAFTLTLAITLGAAGCADIEHTLAQAHALRDHASDARTGVASELDGLEQQRDRLGDNPPPAIASDLDLAIAGARARLGALDAALAHADRVIDEMERPTDGITQGVGALAPFLPPGTQGPALLGAALIATLLRARQVRTGADSIVASIQSAMKDPEFKQAFERQAGTIRSIQTPAARRIVDRATGKPAPLRSPL